MIENLDEPGLRRFALELVYDGSAFRGWQMQPGERTVQQVVQDWCSQICNQGVKVIAAGRTDTGVHARATLCSFRTTTGLAAGKLFRGIRRVMPPDVRVLRLHEFEDLEFSARFSARWRSYEYRLHCGLDPFLRDRSWCLNYNLDIAAMRAAMATLHGKQDCRAFCVTKSLPETPVCWFHNASLEVQDQELVFKLQADRFLHSQVRNTIGTIVAIGKGMWPVERMNDLLKNGRREDCGSTAPAHGLYLNSIGYPRFQTGIALEAAGTSAYRLMEQGESASAEQGLPEVVFWKGPSHGTREEALQMARRAAKNQSQNANK